jgi:regulator of replication initiation timing
MNNEAPSSNYSYTKQDLGNNALDSVGKKKGNQESSKEPNPNNTYVSDLTSKIKLLDEQVQIIENQISQLSKQLEDEKNQLKSLNETNLALSSKATIERAKTQEMGRGLLGSLMGSEYRASQRRVAARINASISRQVSEKREQIRSLKLSVKNNIIETQSLIKAKKEELKSLKSQRKELQSALKNTKRTKDNLSLLKKLGELYKSGLITEEEYEQKKKKLLDQI